MAAVASPIDLLLAELESGLVIPERYSHRSLWGRCEPAVVMALLAAATIIGSMLLAELTRPRA